MVTCPPLGAPPAGAPGAAPSSEPNRASRLREVAISTGGLYTAAREVGGTSGPSVAPLEQLLEELRLPLRHGRTERLRSRASRGSGAGRARGSRIIRQGRARALLWRSQRRGPDRWQEIAQLVVGSCRGGGSRGKLSRLGGRFRRTLPPRRVEDGSGQGGGCRDDRPSAATGICHATGRSRDAGASALAGMLIESR